jgi:hypothetical protein
VRDQRAPQACRLLAVERVSSAWGPERDIDVTTARTLLVHA